MDFGLNPQPFGVPDGPIAITQRIVTNYYTAKRMFAALQMTVSVMRRYSAPWRSTFRSGSAECLVHDAAMLRLSQFEAPLVT